MQRLRLAATLTTCLVLLAACGREDDTGSAVVRNDLLALVPADAPYVFANLEPVPADIMDAWLLRAEPLLRLAQEELSATSARLAEELDDVTGDLAGDVPGMTGADAAMAAVAQAVLAELDGKLSREGLASLGLSLDASHVVHGHGLFPVLRMGLGDPALLRAAIARVEAASGQPIPELRSGEDSYWRIGNDAASMAAWIAIRGDHLAIGAAPLASEAGFLDVLLGRAVPAESMADGAALLALNREGGYTPWGSGWLDVRRVLGEFLDPASTTATALAGLGDFDPSTLDPACATEAQLAAAFVPRLSAGISELTGNSVAVRSRVDVQPLLAKELADLVSEVPAASSDPVNLVAASLAVRVGRVRDFARGKAELLAAVDFKCPQLREARDSFRVAAEKLSQPVPLPIGNLMGLRVVLASLEFVDGAPPRASGLLSLEVENPQMLIGTASMVFPGFEELGIEPGAGPVQVPQELLSVVTPEVDVHAMMGARAIGIAYGAGMRDALVPFMDAGDAGNDGTFASLEYDMARMAELQGEWVEGDSADPAHAARQRELMDAWLAMAGRARLAFRFDEQGLVVESRTSFD